MLPIDALMGLSPRSRLREARSSEILTNICHLPQTSVGMWHSQTIPQTRCGLELEYNTSHEGN